MYASSSRISSKGSFKGLLHLLRESRGLGTGSKKCVQKVLWSSAGWQFQFWGCDGLDGLYLAWLTSQCDIDPKP